MDFYYLLKGAIVGFTAAAPIGPIGAICIKNTLEHGRLSGFFSGIGAALGSTCYGALAAFGLSLVSNFILGVELWMRLIGGAFLIYLGLRTFLSKGLRKNLRSNHTSLIGDFVSTFLLTLINPMTIISYLAIFAGLGIANTHGNLPHAILLTTGVFMGAITWWIILTEGLTLLKDHLTQEKLKIINKVVGACIVGFGLFAWISCLFI